VPEGLLRAIGRVESGRFDSGARALVPWPWTVDVDGVGYFYETKAAAVAAVRAFQARGTRSIDVGCLQVNLLHHPDAFADLDQAFDPQANVVYGARFLRQLFTQTGSWPLAAAAYHSKTPELGAKYGARVLAQWGRTAKGAFPAVASRYPGTLAARASPYPAWPPPGVAYAAFAPTNFAYRAFANQIEATALSRRADSP
jgi:hypothetical protein